MIIKKCPQCDIKFKARHSKSKYCSRACSFKSRAGKPAWNRGIDHLSPEAKKRIGKAMKKRLAEKGHPKGMLGKLHTQEKRDQISKTLLNGRPRVSKVPQGYQYGHLKVRLVRGKPKFCVFCKTNEPNERYDWASLNKNYHDPFDYVPACRPCHNRFDKNIIKLPKNYGQ